MSVGKEKASLLEQVDSRAQDGTGSTHLSEKCLLLEDAGPYSDREQTFGTSAGQTYTEHEDLTGDLTLREELQRMPSCDLVAERKMYGGGGWKKVGGREEFKRCFCWR